MRSLDLFWYRLQQCNDKILGSKSLWALLVLYLLCWFCFPWEGSHGQALQRQWLWSFCFWSGRYWCLLHTSASNPQITERPLANSIQPDDLSTVDTTPGLKEQFVESELLSEKLNVSQIHTCNLPKLSQAGSAFESQQVFAVQNNPRCALL